MNSNGEFIEKPMEKHIDINGMKLNLKIDNKPICD